MATGSWRRGREQKVAWAELSGDVLLVELASGRKIELPAERVRSAYACAGRQGRVRVSLELEGGLTDGDRMVLELEPRFAAPIAARLAKDAAKFDLAREGTRTSAVLHVTSIVLGFAFATLLTMRLEHAIPGAQSGDALNWWLGLGVAASGFFHAAVALLSSPPTVTIGVDGVRIEGILRRRFVPYSEIATVRRSRLGLTIRCAKRAVYVFAPGAGEARLDALTARITEHTDRAKHAPEPARDREGPRSVREMKAALERSLEPSTYRDAPENDASLSEALLSPNLTRRARLATAATLAARGERDKIRVAAHAFADDTTRALLERISEEEADIESIEAAMERAR
ncbi:MAG TPA: hypothetical protein VL400_20440, partial [Polyangiaceae bacterium]|nr:hypothetical protein [Polyangiaceae bacterium]